ncbi:MAG: hypothetical protein WDW36_003426 [Sanguina aurantia]
MGGCCSSTGEKYAANGGNANSGKATSAAAAAAKASKVPDFGLLSTHTVIKLLGRGGEGETWLCRDLAKNTEVAVKLIKRPIPKAAIQVIKREIKIQADLGAGHLNIVNADEVVLSKTHLGLVMEYVPGGNMVQYVTKKRESKGDRSGLCLDEDEARFYFKQLIMAVEYCHRNNVAHRDLKLDNTLLDEHTPPRLKLCDFGFAKHWNMSSNMDTMRIGTPEYMGPELISSRVGYDGKKVDVWAAGVLLYVMLVGMFPFETQDDNFNNTAGLYDIWLQQIKTSWRELPNNSSVAPKLTSDLKDMLDKMFDVKSESRIGIDQIKAHPWFDRPLSPKYMPAFELLVREQDALDEELGKSPMHLPDRDKALEAMLDKAASNALPNDVILRVSLCKVKKSDLAAANGMTTLTEEE